MRLYRFITAVVVLSLAFAVLAVFLPLEAIGGAAFVLSPAIFFCLVQYLLPAGGSSSRGGSSGGGGGGSADDDEGYRRPGTPDVNPGTGMPMVNEHMDAGGNVLGAPSSSYDPWQ